MSDDLALPGQIPSVFPSVIGTYRNRVVDVRVMFLGDSITHGGGYISMIEYFLHKKYPEKAFDMIGIGLSSETASGLSEKTHPFPRPCIHERLDRALAKVKPDVVVACVGGGSNAAGMFYSFIDDSEVELIGVEAGGRSDRPGDHAATLSYGHPGVLHGSFSYVMQDEDGQITEGHSISAGLDYPGIGPEHAWLKDSGRARYDSITDEEALAEGVIDLIATDVSDLLVLLGAWGPCV